MLFIASSCIKQFHYMFEINTTFVQVNYRCTPLVKVPPKIINQGNLGSFGPKPGPEAGLI